MGLISLGEGSGAPLQAGALEGLGIYHENTKVRKHEKENEESIDRPVALSSSRRSLRPL
jgi:hypothetical protein